MMELEERRLGLEIKKIKNLVGRCIEKRTAKVKERGNVTTMQGWILGFLYRNKEIDVFQKDIEKAFQIRRATATNIMKLMEKNNLVIKTSVDRDARLKKISLTEDGLTMYHRIFSEIDAVERDIVKGISEEELFNFYQTLDKIKCNLKKMEASRND